MNDFKGWSEIEKREKRKEDRMEREECISKLD
jgi:hypothetical protein